MLEFFYWALTEGTKSAEKLRYVSIPQKYVPLIETLWIDHIRVDGVPLWKTRVQHQKEDAGEP